MPIKTLKKFLDDRAIKYVTIKHSPAFAAREIAASAHVAGKELAKTVVGAMPPFGNLYDMDVYVEETLGEDEEIAFNAGTHTELVKLSYHDFERLVRPTAVRLAAVVT